jgi:hypothetical protein
MFEFVALAVLVVCVAVVHVMTQRRLGGATVAREQAVQKQAKTLARRAAQSEVRASMTHDRCEHLLARTQEMHENAQLLHQRADDLLREVNARG